MSNGDKYLYELINSESMIDFNKIGTNIGLFIRGVFEFIISIFKGVFFGQKKNNKGKQGNN
jgi:hypothetical protein